MLLTLSRSFIGSSLVVNSMWKNPSGEWHVGYKLVYDLFTETLTARVKVRKLFHFCIYYLNCTQFVFETLYGKLLLFPGQKDRQKKWDEKNQEAIAKAVKHLEEFDQVKYAVCTFVVTQHAFLGQNFLCAS